MTRSGIAVIGAMLALALTASTAGCASFGGFRSEEEAPIYVKNGSMEITTDDEWVPQNPDLPAGFYSHERPGRPSSSDLFYVRVKTGASGRCTPADTFNEFEGSSVLVDYSTPGVQARFHRYGPPNNRRTKLTPARLFQLISSSNLRYSGQGYITAVSVLGGGADGVCTFDTHDLNVEIAICAGPRSECRRR